MAILTSIANVIKGTVERITTKPENIEPTSINMPKGLAPEVSYWIEWGKTPRDVTRDVAANQLKADTLERTFSALGLGTSDFKFDNALSSTAKRLNDELSLDPTLKRTNLDSASLMQDMYNSKAASAGGGYEKIEKLYMDWANTTNYNKLEIYSGTTARSEFEKLLYLEQDSRWQTGTGLPSTPESIKLAADTMDAIHAQNLAHAKDTQNGGLNPVYGMENIPENSGYVPRRVDLRKYNEAVFKHGKKKVYNTISDAIYSGFGKLGGVPEGYTKADIDIFAKAVIRSIETKNSGFFEKSTFLSKEDRDTARQAFLDSGAGIEQVDRLMALVEGNKLERGKPSFSRGRLPMDMSYSKDGLSMTDIYDTNATHLSKKYTRAVSGRSALARKGIKSDVDIDNIKRAIATEQDAIIAKHGVDKFSQDRFISDKDLDFLFSHFKGGAVGEEASPAVFRLKTAANLLGLNKLGLSQAIESSAGIASVGLTNWLSYAPLLNKMMNNSKSYESLAHELNSIFGSGLTNQHKLFMDDNWHDIIRNPQVAGGLWETVDRLLLKGQRLQGYISAFYKVASGQRLAAVCGMSNKLAQGFRDGKLDISKARLGDLGITGEFAKQLEKEFKTNATFDKNGMLSNLGLDNWDIPTREKYFRALRSHVDTVVQDSAVGQTARWHHKDIARLMLQWRSFSLLALHKQMLPIIRHMDTEAASAISYSLATASLGYIVRTITDEPDEKERAKKLTTTAVLHGALRMSNPFSGIYEISDPVFAMLDLDGLRGMYNKGGVSQNNINYLMPSLGMLGAYPDAVRAIARKAKGETLTRQDIGALQTASIIGRMYGMSYIFNSMKPTSKSASLEWNKKSEQPKKENIATETSVSPELNNKLTPQNIEEVIGE